VASLWDAVRTEPYVATLERFTLAVDLLFAMGAVTFEGGLLRRGRVSHDVPPSATDAAQPHDVR